MLYTKEKLTPHPGGHVCQQIKLILAILVEAHPRFFKVFFFWFPCQPDVYMEWKYFSNFQRGPA